MNVIKEGPFNVGVIFDQEVESGGGFQQGLNAAKVASKIDPKLAKIYFFHTKRKSKKLLLKHGIDSNLIKLSLLKKIYLFIKTTDKYRGLYKILRPFLDFNFFESFLKKQYINLVYFISPSRFALDLVELNFIYTVWDLCHLDYPEFPESKLKGEFENREMRLNLTLKKAVAVIVDSQYTKSNLSKKYNIEDSRIAIIPFEPLKDIKEDEYADKPLVNIYKKYKDEGFEIIGFPCNQFAFQEPGSNQEIKEFCDTNYGVTFEIMNKIKVNGPKAIWKLYPASFHTIRTDHIWCDPHLLTL